MTFSNPDAQTTKHQAVIFGLGINTKIFVIGLEAQGIGHQLKA